LVAHAPTTETSSILRRPRSIELRDTFGLPVGALQLEILIIPPSRRYVEVGRCLSASWHGASLLFHARVEGVWKSIGTSIFEDRVTDIHIVTTTSRPARRSAAEQSRRSAPFPQPIISATEHRRHSSLLDRTAIAAVTVDYPRTAPFARSCATRKSRREIRSPSREKGIF
jgi:hypothetical protein